MTPKHAAKPSWATSILQGLFILALLCLVALSSSYQVDPDTGVVLVTRSLGFHGSEWLTLMTERIDQLDGRKISEWTLVFHFNVLPFLALLYMLIYATAEVYCRRVHGHDLDAIIRAGLQGNRIQRLKRRLIETRYFEAQRRLLWRASMAAAGAALAVNLLLPLPYRYTIEFAEPAAAVEAQEALVEALSEEGHSADVRVQDDGMNRTLVIEGWDHAYGRGSIVAEAVGRTDRVAGVTYEFGNTLHPWTLSAALLALALALLIGIKRRPRPPRNPAAA